MKTHDDKGKYILLEYRTQVDGRLRRTNWPGYQYPTQADAAEEARNMRIDAEKDFPGTYAFFVFPVKAGSSSDQSNMYDQFPLFLE